MNDRHYVELVILPMLMQEVAMGGIRVSDDVGGFFKLIGLLDEAMRQPIAGLHLKDQAKVMRRAQRVRDQFSAEVRFTDTLGLVTYFILRDLMDGGYLEVGAASPLWRATEIFMASLEKAANEPGQWELAEAKVAIVMRILRAERLFENAMQEAARPLPYQHAA